MTMSSSAAPAAAAAVQQPRRTLRLVVFDLDYTIWQPEMYQLCGKPRLAPTTTMTTDPNNKSSSTRRRKSTLTASELRETKTTQEGMMLTDGSGTPIRVFPGAAHALAEIQSMKAQGHDIQAAVASKTDEPDWAHYCMQHLALSVVDRDVTTTTTTTTANDNAETCNATSTKNNDTNNGNTPTAAGTIMTLKDCFFMKPQNGPNNMKNTHPVSLIEIAFDNKQYHLRQLQKKTGIAFGDMVFFDNEYGNIQSVSKLGVHCIYTPDGMQQQHWEEAKRVFGVDSSRQA